MSDRIQGNIVWEGVLPSYVDGDFVVAAAVGVGDNHDPVIDNSFLNWRDFAWELDQPFGALVAVDLPELIAQEGLGGYVKVVGPGSKLWATIANRLKDFDKKRIHFVILELRPLGYDARDDASAAWMATVGQYLCREIPKVFGIPVFPIFHHAILGELYPDRANAVCTWMDKLKVTAVKQHSEAAQPPIYAGSGWNFWWNDFGNPGGIVFNGTYAQLCALLPAFTPTTVPHPPLPPVVILSELDDLKVIHAALGRIIQGRETKK
jgi:hypothetical protein